MPFRRKSKNPLFDEAFWATDPLGMNANIARLGSTYGTLRKLPDDALITYVDSLILEESFRADIDFYMRELLRREQARTNTVLIWLASVATFATIIGGIAAILALR